MKTVFPNRSQRWLSHVALGGALLVMAVWIFAPDIRAFLQSVNVASADRQVAAWLHASSSASFTGFMRWLSLLHGTAGILTLMAITAIVLWRYGERQTVPGLIATIAGGMLLNVAVKQAVHRARPDWGYALQALESFSFPSGHAAGATLFYGMLVVLLWPGARTARMRLALLIAATSMVLLVATSRIVLGVHYLSDCIAGVLEALLWLAICQLAARPTARSTTALSEEP